MNPTSAELQASVKERFAKVARSPDQEKKFLVGPDGAVIARFRPLMEPEDPAIVSAIEANLPG